MSSSRDGFDKLLPEIYLRYKEYALYPQKVAEAQAQVLKEREFNLQLRQANGRLNRLLAQPDFGKALENRDFEIDEFILANLRDVINAAEREENPQKKTLWEFRLRMVEAAYSKQKENKATRLFQQILEADDIEQVLSQSRDKLNWELLEVVNKNQKQAVLDGETELAEGLADLSQYISTVLKEKG
jgi:hypothetical protein